MTYEEVVKFIRGKGGYTNARTELRRMLGEMEGTGVTTEIANLTQGALIARLTQGGEQGEGEASVYTGGRGLGNSTDPGGDHSHNDRGESHGDGGEVEGGDGVGGDGEADCTPTEGRQEQGELELDCGSTGRSGNGGRGGDANGGLANGGVQEEPAEQAQGEGESAGQDGGAGGQTGNGGEDDELARLERQLAEAQAAAREAAEQERRQQEALDEARRKAEEERRRKAEEYARKKAEEEERKKAERAAKKKAEQEASRRQDEERRRASNGHSMTNEVVETLRTTGLAFLVGPAGTGKTTLAVGACEVLFGVNRDDPRFNEHYAQISFSPDTTAGEMIGRADVNGGFTESEIVRVFRDGGLILFDEIDNADASMLVKLNTAIANGYIATPRGLVRRNENTVIVCTGNTFGTGADAMYVGRARLDAATLDRFTLCTIFVDYDVKMEKRIADSGGIDDANKKWLAAFVKVVRKCIANNRFRRICSTRFVVNAVKWLAAGKSKKWVADKFLVPWKENERTAVVNCCIGDASTEEQPAAAAS